ncbi:putative F-box protein At1g47730 [Apium graveolens]|uniref:putative F-box protein At1g47730 n=1 Tax=Apium graveolens TaxID=4045 RepID=UPI003D792A30
MGTRARGKIGESNTSFNDLPEEMAAFIFTKLPVKYLIRSTSVSKTWYSLIINPNFISSQITHSLSSCDQNAVLIIPTHLSHRNYCTLVSAETGYVFDKYEIPFTTKSGTLKFVDSVNGLVCVNDLRSSNTLYLWNPCLRKYKCIESTCFSADLFLDSGKRSSVIGLGFHERTNDYRVIRIVSCVDNKNVLVSKVVPKVEVFSLRMNEWREIQNPIGPRLSLFKFRKTVNSIMYGLSSSHPEKYSDEVGILSFDFNNEVFGQLKLPDDVRYCLGEIACFNLMKFEGSLCVCVFNKCVGGDINTHPFCIWLMRNEDGIISWTKRFNVVLDQFGFPCQLTKSGALIMISLTNSPVRSVISCNLKNLQCKYLGFDNSLDFKIKLPATVDTSFIESLVMHAGGDILLETP